MDSAITLGLVTLTQSLLMLAMVLTLNRRCNDLGDEIESLRREVAHVAAVAALKADHSFNPDASIYGEEGY